MVNGYRKEFYNNTIDGFAFCCLENKYIGYVPFEECKSTSVFSLRVSNPKNNQKAFIKYANQFKL